MPATNPPRSTTTANRQDARQSDRATVAQAKRPDGSKQKRRSSHKRRNSSARKEKALVHILPNIVRSITEATPPVPIPVVNRNLKLAPSITMATHTNKQHLAGRSTAPSGAAGSGSAAASAGSHGNGTSSAAAISSGKNNAASKTTSNANSNATSNATSNAISNTKAPAAAVVGSGSKVSYAQTAKKPASHNDITTAATATTGTAANANATATKSNSGVYTSSNHVTHSYSNAGARRTSSDNNTSAATAAAGASARNMHAQSGSTHPNAAASSGKNHHHRGNKQQQNNNHHSHGARGHSQSGASPLSAVTAAPAAAVSPSSATTFSTGSTASSASGQTARSGSINTAIAQATVPISTTVTPAATASTTATMGTRSGASKQGQSAPATTTATTTTTTTTSIAAAAAAAAAVPTTTVAASVQRPTFGTAPPVAKSSSTSSHISFASAARAGSAAPKKAATSTTGVGSAVASRNAPSDSSSRKAQSGEQAVAAPAATAAGSGGATNKDSASVKFRNTHQKHYRTSAPTETKPKFGSFDSSVPVAMTATTSSKTAHIEPSTTKVDLPKTATVANTSGGSSKTAAPADDAVVAVAAPVFGNATTLAEPVSITAAPIVAAAPDVIPAANGSPQPSYDAPPVPIYMPHGQASGMPAGVQLQQRGQPAPQFRGGPQQVYPQTNRGMRPPGTSGPGQGFPPMGPMGPQQMIPMQMHHGAYPAGVPFVPGQPVPGMMPHPAGMPMPMGYPYIQQYQPQFYPQYNQYGFNPMYAPAGHAGNFAGSLPHGAGQSGPTAAVPIVSMTASGATNISVPSPRKSAAIKIVNPSTKEEVKLPISIRAPSPSPAPVIVAVPVSAPVPVPVAVPVLVPVPVPATGNNSSSTKLLAADTAPAAVLSSKTPSSTPLATEVAGSVTAAVSAIPSTPSATTTAVAAAVSAAGAGAGAPGLHKAGPSAIAIKKPDTRSVTLKNPITGEVVVIAPKAAATSSVIPSVIPSVTLVATPSVTSVATPSTDAAAVVVKVADTAKPDVAPLTTSAAKPDEAPSAPVVVDATPAVVSEKRPVSPTKHVKPDAAVSVVVSPKEVTVKKDVSIKDQPTTPPLQTAAPVKDQPTTASPQTAAPIKDQPTTPSPQTTTPVAVVDAAVEATETQVIAETEPLSVAEDASELEEGQIVEATDDIKTTAAEVVVVKRPPTDFNAAVPLTTTAGIKYPEGVVMPDLASGSRKYSFEALRSLSFVRTVPAGLDLTLFECSRRSGPPSSFNRGAGYSQGGNSSSNSLSMGSGVGLQRQSSSSDSRGNTLSRAARSSHGTTKGQVYTPAPSQISRQPSSGGPSMSRQPSSGRGVQVPSRASYGHGNQSGRNSFHGSIAADPAPSEDFVPYVKTADAWAPLNKKDLDAATVVLRTTLGLLNKLTIDTFEKLSEKILNVGIDNQEILDGVVSHIYEKALDQPTFAPMYAKLCDYLLVKLPEVQQWMVSDRKSNEFRRCIVRSCQKEFVSHQKWAISDQAQQAERAEKRRNMENLTPEEREQIGEEDYRIAKVKRRSLGNTRFIGELYMTHNKIISSNVIRNCISNLIRPDDNDPDEEELESLCKLMTTVGKALDAEEMAVKALPNAPEKFMDKCMGRMIQLTKKAGLSSRLEFMLMDVVDLRANGWVPRAGSTVSGPKKIAELRRDAEEQLRKEAERSASRGHRSSGGGNRNLPGRAQQSKGYGGRSSGRQDSVYGGSSSGYFGNSQSGGLRSDTRNDLVGGSSSGGGWESAPRTSSRSSHVPDLQRFGKISSTAGSNMTLGPNSRTHNSWSVKTEDAPKPKGNKFAALMSEESEESSNAKPDVEGEEDHSSGVVSESSDTEVVQQILTEVEQLEQIESSFKEYAEGLSYSELLEDLAGVTSKAPIIALVDKIMRLLLDRNGRVAAHINTLLLKLFGSGLYSIEWLWEGFKDCIVSLENDMSDYPNAWILFSMIFTPLIEKRLLSLSKFVEIVSAANAYDSACPTVVADAVAATLNDLPGALILNCGIRKQLDVLDQDSHYRWFNAEADAAVLESPMFISALTTTMVDCVASQTIYANENGADDTLPDLYPQQKALMAQLTQLISPYLLGNESKMAVLEATQTYCESKDYPTGYYANLLRLYHDLDLIEPELFDAFQKTVLESNNEVAIEHINAFTTYLKTATQE
ncbi:hypothetical protein BSLG_008072 [Batrachochytrium salamandrivorans]|nr:hypothetical protein BSLG_008072 [Batrachochytrium salamandrivorans]